MLAFKGGTLPLKETVTMLRSRGVIPRGCILMPDTCVGNYSYTEENALLHDSPLYEFFLFMNLYIYIYVDIYVYVFINMCM